MLAVDCVVEERLDMGFVYYKVWGWGVVGWVGSSFVFGMFYLFLERLLFILEEFGFVIEC